ncbi:MAG: HAMP domain-containing protein [Caldilineaceae bacterium]|nr:HAMP domain-containing protein [Caldilineaceae bacterium]
MAPSETAFVTQATPARAGRPWNRMWVRLSIYFSSFAILSALLLVIAARLLVTDTIRQSLLPEQLEAPGGIIDTLGEYYKSHGDWRGVDNLMQGAQATLRIWSRGLDLSIVDAENNPVYVISQRPLGAGPPPNSPGMGGPMGGGAQGNGRMGWRNASIRLPIESDGKVVGYLEVHAMPLTTGEPNPTRDLFQLLSRYLILIALGGGLLGVVFAVAAGRNLTAPLTQLADAARAIGAGNLRRRVAMQGTEEIVAVAAAFNEMATQLEEAETLRRNLMADVAHELRTPLSVLQGNLRAILDDVYVMDKGEVTKLYTQTRLLGRLVNDLHELAQAEAGQLPLNLLPTDLRPLLREVVDLFLPMAEDAEITLQTQFATTLPAIAVDSVRLRQVLHNLLGNALRHTPPGGTVSVQSRADAQQVTLTIQDNGDGIAVEHLPHLFDRFYRADPARARETGGTGLGLAIARAIIQAHGGDIMAHSDGLGQGSRFTVTLPLP